MLNKHKNNKIRNKIHFKFWILFKQKHIFGI